MTFNNLIQSLTYGINNDRELRIDIRVPEGYPLPELSTRVFPENPDMEYQ